MSFQLVVKSGLWQKFTVKGQKLWTERSFGVLPQR